MPYGMKIKHPDFPVHSIFDYHTLGNRTPKQMLDKEKCLERVRKVIYYILHKRELIYDERGCVRETIRRAEGNHNVVKQVKNKVELCLTK